MASQNQPTPESVYGIFCGDINANNTSKLVNSLTIASNLKVKHVHLLFQSWGGFVGDGVFMKTLLSRFAFDVTVYNAGQVASAGVLAFLGAEHRKTTKSGIFVIHKSSNTGQPAKVQALNVFTKNL